MKCFICGEELFPVATKCPKCRNHFINRARLKAAVLASPCKTLFYLTAPYTSDRDELLHHVKAMMRRTGRFVISPRDVEDWYLEIDCPLEIWVLQTNSRYTCPALAEELTQLSEIVYRKRWTRDPFSYIEGFINRPSLRFLVKNLETNDILIDEDISNSVFWRRFI